MNFDHESIVPLNPYFFGLPIRWYAVFILTGVFLALVFAKKEGKKKGYDPELFENLVLLGLPICILGARLWYVLFNLESYIARPSRILAINEGGLAIHGGVIAAVLFGYWYLKKKKQIPMLPILDMVSIGFFMGQIIGRFGNFMNQEAFGGIVPGANLDAQREFLTNLFIPRFIVDGMFINGNYHHPTFLYEALWNSVGLIIALFVLRKLKGILTGEIAAFYAIWYSVGRFFIEGMRTDSLMIGPLRTAQLVSLFAIVVVAALVLYRRTQKINVVTYEQFKMVDLTKDKDAAKEARKQAYLEKLKRP